MRFLLLSFIPLLIFSFPFVEVYLFFSWLADSPLSAIAYLLVTVFTGLVFIRLAKMGMSELFHYFRSAQANSRRGVSALLVFGKMWIVGILLIFPGYLTDILAVGVWMTAGRLRQESPEIQAQARVLDDDD